MSLRLLGASLLAIVLQLSFPADSAQTLRNRYGPPISENFVIRPGVVASASYGASGHVCEIVVSPQRLWNSTLKPREIEEIVDELAPPSERGKVGTPVFLDGGCPTNDCAGSISNWEKVSITRWGSSEQLHYVTIRFRDECRAQAR